MAMLPAILPSVAVLGLLHSYSNPLPMLRQRAQQTRWILRVDFGLPLESYEDEVDTVAVSLGMESTLGF